MEIDLVPCNNNSRACSRELEHACNLAQKRAKYSHIWAKMYEIWKYFEKRQVIVCDYHTNKLLQKALISYIQSILCIITKGIRPSTLFNFPFFNQKPNQIIKFQSQYLRDLSVLDDGSPLGSVVGFCLFLFLSFIFSMASIKLSDKKEDNL